MGTNNNNIILHTEQAKILSAELYKRNSQFHQCILFCCYTTAIVSIGVRIAALNNQSIASC